MSSNLRKSFAITKLDCRTGFDRTMHGVAMPDDIETEKLYLAFESGHREGNPGLARHLMSDVVGNVDWHWPWMEECGENFDHLNIWPSIWKWRHIKRPLQWEQINAATKIEMLEINMSKCAFMARDLRKSYCNADITTSFQFTLRATPPCAVEAFIVEQKRDAIERGDFSDLPPYFPDDTSWITMLDRQKSKL